MIRCLSCIFVLLLPNCNVPVKSNLITSHLICRILEHQTFKQLKRVTLQSIGKVFISFGAQCLLHRQTEGPQQMAT